MIAIDLARQLRDAGLGWDPATGDRFVVLDREMDEQVFLVSEMTVEAHQAPTGRVIRFNGTTEWALDSIEEKQVVWLPREDQLRALLGDRFQRLEQQLEGFVVSTRLGASVRHHRHADAEGAYARALLEALVPRD